MSGEGSDTEKVVVTPEARAAAIERLSKVVPYLRHAMKLANGSGTAALGVLSVDDAGREGRVIARFEAAAFMNDFCDALGLARGNTEEEDLDASALEIFQHLSGGAS